MLSIKEAEMKLRALIPFFILMVAVAGCGHSQKDAGMTEPAVQAEEAAGETDSTPAGSARAPSGQAVELSADEIEGLSTEDGGFCIYSVHTDKANIIIPAEVNGNPVTEISDYAFGEGKYTYITLPDSVEKIGTAAFIDCLDLTGISLGSGVRYVGNGAFVNCRSLETITFPDGTETIDGFVLGGCDNLKEVYVPASVTGFGDGSRILSVGTCPDAVVITPKGSPAEAVCQEEGIQVRTE